MREIAFFMALFRATPGILSDDLTEAELEQIFKDRRKTIEQRHSYRTDILIGQGVLSISCEWMLVNTRSWGTMVQTCVHLQRGL